jgi:hypothetical protein
VIRVVLPPNLRILAGIDGEVSVDVVAPATQQNVIDALEARYPVLRGTIRDQHSQKRRAYVRIFGCERDLSHDSPETPLPEAIERGTEPLLVVGAMSGG